ncbi:phytoene synthase [Marispirochaeta aestuarii]|uniref:Phytoene synthase n=1 Tax=Marispirochaeta aestuarii TaxID=1963862 RepID=A0A1Y1S399_9SPIO|nr:phytoene/squalene synthase family protein [Marispirochaeta aestuarii]ORC37842.1 phytoene synthase [Marispirochaeta aestuarii]
MEQHLQAQKLHRDIFKAGSKTYFNSSLFFPKKVREEVFILYAFVRVADNYVDAIPQDREGFNRFRENYRRAVKGEITGDPVTDSFVKLASLRDFDPLWTEAFFKSMEMDLHKKNYDSLEETLEYIYGSAEVIGLFMARIMGLPDEAHHPACRLGRSMQYINFIRDIAEDNSFGRRYLPLEESGLVSLKEEETRKKPEQFRRFMQLQTERYKEWQREAEEGYALIPRRYRIPIRTAGDMYTWSAGIIEQDPFIVYRRKVKPSRARIIASIAANLFRA